MWWFYELKLSGTTAFRTPAAQKSDLKHAEERLSAGQNSHERPQRTIRHAGAAILFPANR
jgi:hypothetical protein